MIWVATAADGAFVIDPYTAKILMRFHREGRNGRRLPESAISSFLDYNDSLVLITTSTEMFAYNRKTGATKPVSIPEGVSGFVAAMEKDRQGYVWLSTSSGLYRIDIFRGIFVRFNREDGILNDRFTLAASFTLPDGRIAFGSNNHFIIFDPEHMFSHTEKPKVHITNFRVMNKSLRLDSLQELDLVRLGPKSNSIQVDFSTLRYAVRYQVRYMLEGLDKDWIYAEENNQAIYSYLPGGTYTLRMQALNEEGQVGEETKLRIRVQPPFWKSWWFFSGIVLIAVGILFLIDRERTRRKKAIQDMRADISNNLHGEINNALNNINILSEMARLKADKDPAKAGEYVEQIHSRSHHMIVAMDDMLWSLDPRNDNMQKTVERMREYIDALNNRHGAYIDMVVDRSVEQLKLNMKLRHDAFLLFKEGILNLVQAGVSICHIHFSLEKSMLVFLMQFDTESADIQQLNNLFHRHDMEKRIDALQAAMKVKVQKNSTSVKLEIPVS
jgi:signal transduction histidine kinase